MNELTFEQYMEQHNPFAMKDKNNKVLYFSDYAELYLFVMKLLRRECKRGYIDLVLFMMEHCGMDKVGAGDYWRSMRIVKFATYKEGFVLIDWNDIENFKNELRKIMEALHLITETDFSISHFEKAWEIFIDELEPVTLAEIEGGE